MSGGQPKGGVGGGGRVDAAGIDCHGITATNCQGRYIICVGRQWFHPVVSSPPAGSPRNKSSKINSSTLLITLVKSQPCKIILPHSLYAKGCFDANRDQESVPFLTYFANFPASRSLSQQGKSERKERVSLLPL